MCEISNSRLGLKRSAMVFSLSLPAKWGVQWQTKLGRADFVKSHISGDNLERWQRGCTPGHLTLKWMSNLLMPKKNSVLSLGAAPVSSGPRQWANPYQFAYSTTLTWKERIFRPAVTAAAPSVTNVVSGWGMAYRSFSISAAIAITGGTRCIQGNEWFSQALR